MYQNRLKLGVKKHNASINEAYFKNEKEDNPGNYSEEQAEVLCELLDNDSEWLHIQEVYVNEVDNDTSPIMYRVRVNDQGATALFNSDSGWLHIQEVYVNEVDNDISPIMYRVRVNVHVATALFNTAASMSVISAMFFNSLKHKPKIISCRRMLRAAGGEALFPKGKCFLQIKIGKQTFRDRIIIIQNLSCNYIIGAAMQRLYHIATGFSITGRHFLSVNGQMLAQSIPTPTMEAIIKNKGKVKLGPHLVRVISIKTPPNININQIYKTSHKFSLPNSVMPVDVVHKIHNKVPHELNIPIFNTNNHVANITKNTALHSLKLAEQAENIFSIEWDRLLQTKWFMVDEVQTPQERQEQVHDLLPEMPQTNLQLEADKSKQLEISTPDADVLTDASLKLQQLLEAKYSSIVSKSAMDIGRNNLIELDIPTKCPPITCKPYSIPLKYQDFVDQEIKQLEDVGIISCSMSNWASPILVVPKKADPNTSNIKDKQFNRFCTDYHKLNSRILTARQKRQMVD